MNKQKQLLAIIAILGVALAGLTFLGVKGGEYYRACAVACYEKANLTFIEADYLSSSCKCIFKANRTVINAQPR